MKGRQRGRNGGKPRMHHQGGGGRNPNFDHNAGRMRGNAQQLMDKFLALARDASSQGDRVLAENYFQHADHYYRVINARFEGQQGNQQGNQQNNQQRRFNGPQQQGGYDGQDGQGNYAQAPYNEHGRLDIPPPAPSQNLMPNAMPVVDANQPLPQVQSQPVYEGNYQPSGQPAPREPDGDIGLPPQLFGGQPQRGPDTQGQDEPQGGGQNRGGDDRGFRPRHSGRRRFGGRRDGAPEASSTDGS